MANQSKTYRQELQFQEQGTDLTQSYSKSVISHICHLSNPQANLLPIRGPQPLISCQDCLNKLPLGGSSNRNAFCHSSGGYKPNIMVSGKLILAEAAPLVLQVAFFSWSFLCAPASLLCPNFLLRHQARLDQCPPKGLILTQLPL